MVALGQRSGEGISTLSNKRRAEQRRILGIIDSIGYCADWISYINKKNYNICCILLYYNYYTTLQGRYHEEQKTMSTPWQHIKDMNSTKINTHKTVHTRYDTTDPGVCFALVTRPATEAPDAEQ